MNASKSVTAMFVSKPLLTVTTSGTGTVTSNPAGINCPADCSEHYDTGTVTLTANPGADSTFAGWTGCDVVEADGSCTMTMNGDRSVTATFDDPVILAPSNRKTLFDILHTTRLN
jgi:hypothetical protein